MMMKNSINAFVLAASFLFLPIFQGVAQQLPQFSQYMFNSLHINPGYAGYKDAGYIQGTYRNQWANFPGAPKTIALSADFSTNEGQTGIGVSVMNDQIGASDNKTALLTYARRIKLSRKSFVGLGMSSGVSQYKLDGSMLKMNDLNDGILPNGIINKTVPNLNIGFFYHNSNFYLGASTFNVIGKSLLKTKDFIFIQHDRHHFLTGGALFKMNQNLQFKPSFLVKHTEGSPTSVDLNALFLLNEKVWVGGSYRTNVRSFEDQLQERKELNEHTALVGLAEVFLTPDLRLGYSFDYNLNVLNNVRASSHELSIGIYFRRTVTENNSQRCF